MGQPLPPPILSTRTPPPASEDGARTIRMAGGSVDALARVYVGVYSAIFDKWDGKSNGDAVLELARSSAVDSVIEFVRLLDEEIA